MLIIKKAIVTIAIQMRLKGIRACMFSPKRVSVEPVKVPRVRFTICVRGRTAKASPCAVSGSDARGKNVPLKNIIGVMSRKKG